jgi:hypothetical protein
MTEELQSTGVLQRRHENDERSFRMRIDFATNGPFGILVKDLHIKLERTRDGPPIHWFATFVPENYGESGLFFKTVKGSGGGKNHIHALLGNQVDLITLISEREPTHWNGLWR